MTDLASDPHDDAPQNQHESEEKSLWHYLGLSLSIVVLIGVVLIAAAAIIVPRVVGGQTLTVLTGSMEPSYPPGTLVVIRPVDPADISVGDVITYQLESGKPAVATHRVVEVGFRADGERQLITQGDANSIPDAEPVREVQIRGRLWYAIPYLGWVSNAVTNEQRQLVVPTIGVALLGYASWLIYSGARDKRHPDREGRRNGSSIA